LFGLRGEVIGALDISGTGHRDVSQVGEAFRLAAFAVEQRLFATLRGCHLLRIQHDARWLGTPLAGVLAVEEDGRLRAASRLARRMLSLPQGEVLPDVDLRELFNDAPPAQMRRLLSPRRGPQRLARADGSHVLVQYARAPLNASNARRADAIDMGRHTETSSDPASGGGRSLQEQALSAIRQAVREHDGNIAAAARQLGISRATIYTKLRQAGMVNERDA
jgi:transcriptional regulator of acetoin/glycerol metabolism